MINSRNIAKALVSLKSSPDITTDFMAFIQKYQLEEQLSSVLAHLKREANQERERNTVHIKASFELDQKTIASIKHFLGAGTEMQISVQVEKGLLGGFVSHVKNVKTDASIAGSLRRLEKSLLNTSISN